MLGAGAAAALVGAAAIAFGGNRHDAPAQVEPVPHAATPGQQARNLSAWLRQYSR